MKLISNIVEHNKNPHVVADNDILFGLNLGENFLFTHTSEPLMVNNFFLIFLKFNSQEAKCYIVSSDLKFTYKNGSQKSKIYSRPRCNFHPKWGKKTTLVAETPPPYSSAKVGPFFFADFGRLFFFKQIFFLFFIEQGRNFSKKLLWPTGWPTFFLGRLWRLSSKGRYNKLKNNKSFCNCKC